MNFRQSLKGIVSANKQLSRNTRKDINYGYIYTKSKESRIF
jgi:hypothetical protein